MARTLTPEIGTGLLEFPAAYDNFSLATTTLPNGETGLKCNTTPKAFARAYDRSTPDHWSFVTNQSKTINMWVRGTGSTRAFIVGSMQENLPDGSWGSTGSWWLLESGNTMQFNVPYSVTSASALSLGSITSVWKMYTLVYDGSSGTYGYFQAWTNGVVISGSSTVGPISRANTELTLGATANYSYSFISPGASATFEIAKLAVWNRALSLEEIANLHVAMIHGGS